MLSSLHFVAIVSDNLFAYCCKWSNKLTVLHRAQYLFPTGWSVRGPSEPVLKPLKNVGKSSRTFTAVIMRTASHGGARGQPVQSSFAEKTTSDAVIGVIARLRIKETGSVS